MDIRSIKAWVASERQRHPTARAYLALRAGQYAEREFSEVERRFFSGLVMRNGIGKTTRSGRLTELDEWCRTVVALDAHRELDLLDIGISSGITTLEWSESLASANIPHNITAIDLCVEAELTSYAASFHVLSDSTGFPLQFDIFGIAVGKRFRNGGGRWALNIPYGVCRAFHALLQAIERHTPLSFGRRKPVRLVADKLLRSAHIVVREGDLFQGGVDSHQYDIIRVANTLNVAYFSSEEISRALRSLGNMLREGASLIVARSKDNGVTEATIFRKISDGRISILAQLNGGSEVEDVAMSSSTWT